jgi:hypothetical protein
MRVPQGIASNVSFREGKKNEDRFVYQETAFQAFVACSSGCGGAVSHSFDKCQLILATSIR